MTARQLVQELELRERLAAIVDELTTPDVDETMPLTLTDGLLEDLDRLLATAPADRREG